MSITTFLIVTDTYMCIHTYVHMYIHRENRSLIQSLTLNALSNYISHTIPQLLPYAAETTKPPTNISQATQQVLGMSVLWGGASH